MWVAYALLLVASAAGEHVREFVVRENAQAGTMIGHLGDELPDAAPPYTIVPVPGSAVNDDLRIDPHTGEIKTRVPLDRENRDHYALVAIPASGDNVRVVVRVSDENDNAPTFPTPVMNVEFSENTPRDVKRKLNPAKDQDLGVFNTQRYNIVSGNTDNAFRLSSHRERDGVLYLDLQINGFLDRETTDHYELVIEALDGGTPPLRGTMSVNITILDVNDSPPIFTESAYSASIPENATVGTPILKVSATDADSGENGQIEYSINRRQSDKENMFKIDPETGEIIVNKALDFETKELHELVVVARDKGAQPLETTAFVSIRVTDVNDNQPTIDVIFLSDDATPKISESARLDEFVARISVHDPDSKTEYSNVNVTLSGGDGHFDLRTHDNIIYLVVVALPLDRESQSSYTLNVVATDKGSPPLHASRIISLRVTDVNDNAPVFLESEYKANVLEAATPGTPVVQVSATDVDEAENSEIRYSLLPTPQSDWFAIDERSGLVTTKAKVDCETNPMPRLTVVAKDRGNPPLSSTATLVVTVLDVNDNEPIFDQSFYNVSVQESEAVGSCILKMSAIDPDCGVNAIVNYTLGDALARPQFYVKPGSGELCVAAPLDYEANTDFEFPVIATDRGGLSTTAVVKIQVLDTNDNVPAFTVKDYNVSLKEGRISSSEPIVAVTATDADSGRNGAITYRIINGNDNDVFRIDRSTGEIFVTKPSLIRANGKFDLEVSATDGGGLSAPQTAAVHVIVMHAGVSSALFDKPRYNFHIKEDAKVGHVVGTLKATVAERGKQPRYSIISGDPERHFTVEPLTGAIRTAGPLDRETRASYLLNVKAASGNSASFDQTQVQITLEDVNDNTPEFGTSSVRVSVAESAVVGSVVYAARATDEDEGRNAQLTYQLVSATGPSNTFAVNAQHGLVTLLRPLDYENLVRHTLVISAKDGGVPSLSANLTLAVDVQDVNDNTPVFEHESYSASVLESEAINTKILEIQAIDKDTGNNARLTYRIISSENTTNEGFFQVQPTTGWVYLAKALDRETAAQHKMTITATDNGMPPLSASASLIINVIDANDNDPVFSKAAYQFKVEENMNVGAFVGKIAATDADLGDNALLRYSLFPTNTSFAINPVTGIITTKDFLDREFKAAYSLFAEAKDQGTPARYSKVPVSVKITDVNDNSPEIIDPREDVISVREEQQPGAEVARVKAIDRDNGVNSSVTYSIVNERDSDGFGVFVIDPKSGVIKTSTVLDHEERSIYRLTVAATDGGTPPKQTVRQLKVEVLDLNDNRPTFTSSSLSFKVQEDASIGHIVGTVACCDSAINENLINGEEKQISYLLMPLTTDYSPGTFEIDRRTGSLVVARQLDREVQDEYRLEVRALDTSATNNPQSSAVTVKIEIVDVNDNAPQWPQNPINIEISEGTPLGITVFNFTAKDADAGPNGELNFRVVSSLPPSCKTFALDPLTGSLTLTATLDYEVLKEYWLIVEATDMAVNETERMSTLATVHLSITDANDNVPKFVSKNKASVALNTLTGTLYQALAIDADSGDNGKVSYYISSGNELSYFAMEYDTGRLTLSKKFSSDITKIRAGQYKINLTASDHGMPFNRQSHMILQLNLQESTNVPPRFTEAFYKANISEDIRPGSFVTRLTAKSSRGTAGNLTYIIPPGVADDKFVVDPRRGTVTIKSKIDREDRDQYTFPVYVTDASTFQSTTNFDVTTVTITVIDVNDNPPMFKSGSCYPLAVPENNDPEVIHTITATDKDIGANGVITYSITSGNNGNKFAIDHTTGQLTARTLDRETQSKYQLTITAFDHGSPVALQGSCNISIIVEDQNDNDPIFDTGHYSAAIPENAPLDTSVIKVRATDADLGFNKRIVYSLANESQGLFRIDNKTGIIFTTGLFDREEKHVYHFEAVATDEGRYVARSQRVSVEISITDVNDNKPIFTKYPFKEKVATLTPPGQSLLRVSATDNDIGTNAEILYELIDTSNNKFRINPTTGVLTATQSLASENGKLIHLKVMAKDKGNPPQSSIGLIEIRVGESSDQTPLLNFQNASYNVTIEENLSYGKDVLQVTAVRSDGRRQRVIYEFGNGDDQYAFEIDSNSGVIRVNNSVNLDYESHPGPTRHLVVVARTEGTPVLYGYCDVTINLLDQNDNAPRFTQQQYIANVLEGNTKGEFVVQLAAKDSDRGVNARILYHIVDGNHDNAFIIEPAFSGSVKTNIVLDREIRETYKLTVIATDEGDPQMTGTATLRINVVDVNDNQPTFPSPNVIAVSEGTEVGSVLTSVTANDVDTYPALKYSITHEDNRFSIDRYSGKIVLNKALDFETKKVYEVNVSVSDNEHVAKTTLTIKVLDVNDNAPVFDETSYNRILPEGAGNVEIGSVSAKDRDSDDNGKVTYSILGESKGYYIDATSGAIFVNYSTLPSQRDNQLAVMATDHGKPNKSSVAAVRISTGATSEIKPFIGQDTYRITVNEDTERGSSLLQIGGINDVLKKYSLEFLIISGNEGDAFDVSLDGALILVNKLDRETQDSYVLGLAAVEPGKMISYSQNKTSITVFVTVADANDNPPLFSSGDFELTVSEDAKPGSTLSKLTTTDADLYGTPNSAIFYNITSGDDDNLFFVNPLTGILTVNKSLDYDVGFTKYKLIIVACDQGIPSLCNSINVHVSIMDENDNIPAFPVNQYYETVAENERVGTSIFTARATDLDKGKYGILNYTIIPISLSYNKNDDSWKMFQIDSSTGLINTNAVFDYEQKNKYEFSIKASDVGGKSSTVKVRIDIESRDEFYPQFTQKTYNFPIPKKGPLPAGYMIGQTTATDRDKGVDGRIVYQLSTSHPYFKINRTTGVIILKKRVESVQSLFGNHKAISLVITASSGRQGSLTNKTAVEILPDSLAVISDMNIITDSAVPAAASGLSDWALGLLIVFIFIIIIFAAAFLFLHMKNKRHKKVNKPGLNSEGVGATNSYVDPSAFDTIPIRNTGAVNAGNQFAPPKYDEIPPYGPHTASSNSGAATTSELSGSDQSGSSGRGSAEDGEDGEDEEIRMINEGPLQRDSGIHRQTDGVDDDNLSDVSVHNTQEYLARLGIVDTVTGGGASTSSRRCSENVVNKDNMLHHGSIDPMHIFDEDGTHENDITNLIYAKLNEVTGSERASSADENSAAVDRAMVLGAFPTAPGENTAVPTAGPSMTGSLSSIVHSEEELTGSYNWDYLLDWGPQYQPLAHVFSEIARLKDDAVSLQSGNSGASSAKSKGTSISGGKSVPPPLLTTVAPRSCPAPSLSCRQPQHLLPRSPISHDVPGGFSAAAAMSPSFSPSLSPLATRSPSMSPLVGPGLPPNPASRKTHSTMRI
ncbi:protein dachsous [Cydia pomonella]|uniref:protein dachsous n=1 Tax=Cydia pomonella TaxID=82600 RepID=UPI002ADE0998|nr:protein dachsous [Cydia pomonella]XP_061729708.1 protein dachsous [Cydia pomonella]